MKSYRFSLLAVQDAARRSFMPSLSLENTYFSYFSCFMFCDLILVVGL
jgi:hypothetical protein